MSLYASDINAQGTFGRDIVAIKIMHIKQERRNLQAIMTKVRLVRAVSSIRAS